MKITKKDLKQFLKLNQKLGSTIKIQYITDTVLNSTEELYNLYYGGGSIIKVGKNSIMYDVHTIKFTDGNLDEVVDKINELLTHNIADYIHKAFENFKWEYEELKYFDRDKEKYEKFKEEVLRLKKEDK